MLLPQLKRIRWAVRATLFLGVAASVAANILHANHNPISQAISAWPPLALLLTVELTSRVPMHKPALAALRVLATMAIAGIAAWVSYWHMQGVAHNYGESIMSSYLLPISVDGLIVVASVSLVELAGRVRVIEDERMAEAKAAAAPAVAPVQFVQPAPAPAPVFQAPMVAAVARTDEDFDRDALTAEAISQAPVSPAVVPPARPLSYAAPVPPAVVATTRPAPRYANGTPPPARSSVRPAVSTAPRTIVTSPTNRPTTQPAESTTPRQRRPVTETAKLADELEAMDPKLSEAELAKQLGISATRLRQVRREARTGS